MWWIRIGISVVLIGLLLVLGKLDGAGAVLAHTQPLLTVVGLAGLGATRALLAYRWRLLTRAAGTKVSYIRLLRLVFVSGFLGTFVPSGIGTDVVNALGIATHTGNKTAAASFMIVDRIAGLFAVAVIGATAATLLTFYPVIAIPHAWVRTVAGVFVLCSLVVGMTLHPAIRGIALAAARRIPFPRISQAIEGVYEAYYRLGRQPVLVGQIVLAAIINQLVSATATYCLSLAIGLTIPFLFYLLVAPILLVLVMVPVSLGGVGLEEGTLAYLVILAGAPQEGGLALALLYRLLWTVLAVFGGVLYALGGHRPPGVKKSSLMFQAQPIGEPPR